jgi:hypothetical protein
LLGKAVRENNSCCVLVWSWGSIVDIVTACGMDDRWFEFRQQANFLLSKTVTPLLGPTRSIQYAPESFPEGERGRGVMLNIHLFLALWLRMGRVILSVSLYAIMAWTRTL